MIDIAERIRRTFVPTRTPEHIARIEAVNVLLDALRYHEAWHEAGDTARRRFAKRVMFQRWRLGYAGVEGIER